MSGLDISSSSSKPFHSTAKESFAPAVIFVLGGLLDFLPL